MYVLAINGSPRKKWNTATLLGKALEGAAAMGAETELVHLYDLDYKGCSSCFACKLKGGPSYGKCAMQDGLTPVLWKAGNADALLLGSPIYLGNVTGEMRSFMERIIFQYLVYQEPRASLSGKKEVGLVYTMNVTAEMAREWGYDRVFASNERIFQRIFGSAESLVVTDTCQFDDYSRYVAAAFNAEEKAKRRREEFPRDCARAFELGIRLAAEKSGAGAGRAGS